MVVAVVGIVLAVIEAAHHGAVMRDRRRLAQIDAENIRTLRRAQSDAETVLPGIPGIELVGRRVRRIDDPSEIAMFAVFETAVHREIGRAIVAARLADRPVVAASQQLVHALLDQARAVVAAGGAADRQIHDPRTTPRRLMDPIQRLQEAHRVAQVLRSAEASRRQVDEQQRGLAGSTRARAGGPPVAGGDVHRMSTVGALAGVARLRAVAQRLIRIGGAQGGVDLRRRELASVAEPVGMRRIVRRTLVPQGQQPRRAVGIEEVGMGEVEAEIQGRDDAAATGERQALGVRPFPALDVEWIGLTQALAPAIVVKAERPARLEADDVGMAANRPGLAGGEAAGADAMEARHHPEAPRHLVRVFQPDDAFQDPVGPCRR